MRGPMRGVLILAIALLASCASDSGVVATGPNTYLITRQAATGFSGLGALKVDAIREADRYCAKGGSTAHVTRATESKPPYVLGNFPRAEVQFTCVSNSSH